MPASHGKLCHEVMQIMDYWELFWDTGAPEAYLMARDTPPEEETWTTENS